MKQFLKLKIGYKCDREYIEQTLFEFNYVKVESVYRPGEFTCRGQIVDIFPFNFRLPVRITMGLHAIESMRDFTTTEGDTRAAYEELTIVPVHEFFAQKNIPERFISDEKMRPFFKAEYSEFLRIEQVLF